MDGYREHPNEFEPDASAGAPSDVAAAIGTDERRMHVRAYNYWVSLLGGRDFPSIEDLEPADLKDFSANSVLLDFTCGRDNPATPYIGAAIREEGGLDDAVQTIADVPSRSLLSRLTDHYLQIVANRAPVGFEAEFVNQRGVPICYRGILMPFSSDDDTIDFIYGVINWKQANDYPEAAPLVPALPPLVDEPEEAIDRDPPSFAGNSADDEAEEELPDVALDEDAGLADRLWVARETAEAAKSADGRSRAALYRALSQAYDFAVTARDNPEDYAELLEESGMKAQARAPMTPIVKLVFGIDYDKTRLTEFASALAYAQRQQVALGGFQALVEAQPGGLKALVAAERQARRPEPKKDSRGTEARVKLRSAAPLSLAEIDGDEEFSLVLARRSPGGGYEAVAVLRDETMVEQAIRRTA